MDKSTKVIVCGGGIGGLTTAHELAKRGVDVVVYERHDILGGLARSSYYTQDEKTYPVEYSWRVYGTGYKNLLHLLKDIPSGGGKTIYDNLVKIKTFLFPRKSGPAYVLPKEGDQGPLVTNFSWKDKWQILKKTLYCVSICEERMNAMDHIRWTDFCSDLSDEARKYVVRIWGPVLGMDPTYMSFPVVARMMKIVFAGFLGVSDGLFVMNKPTNDAWFDPWEAHLTSTGHVTIKRQHEIQDLILEDDEIKRVVVKNLESGEMIEDTADHVVCALSVESIAELVKRNKDLHRHDDLQRTIPLAEICRQVQLSVQLFLDQEFKYPTNKKNVLYLPDTPWALIIEPEALIWDKTYCSDDRVKSVLSVGLCQTDVVGTVHGKPFTSCTREEVVDEVMDQMATSYHTSITMADGKQISHDSLVLFHMWDTFVYDEKTERLESWEPKFSNNANSFKDQPSVSTSVSNLLFATGYTKTDRFIYSMEAAAEAGVRCANEILKREGRSERTKVFGFSASPLLFKPFAFIDKLLFSFKK